MAAARSIGAPARKALVTSSRVGYMGGVLPLSQMGAVLAVSLFSAAPPVEVETPPLEVERKTRIGAIETVDCPTATGAERHCVRFTATVATTDNAGECHEQTSAMLGDETLIDQLLDAFGLHAPLVCDALVERLGAVVRSQRTQRRDAALLALDILDDAEMVRYHQLQEGVVLAAEIEVRLARIARHYYRETGRTITVTSGTRGPLSQADAMYGKMRAGANIVALYAQRDAARSLRTIYRKGRHAGRSREEIVEEMAVLIRGLMDEGIYISKHLIAGAVDVRFCDMSRRQKTAFRAADKTDPGVRCLLERRPPHFHLSFD